MCSVTDCTNEPGSWCRVSMICQKLTGYLSFVNMPNSYSHIFYLRLRKLEGECKIKNSD